MRLLFVVFYLTVMFTVPRLAEGQEDLGEYFEDSPDQLALAVMQLQPGYRHSQVFMNRAFSIADTIYYASFGEEHDPWIMLAVARRESALWWKVGVGAPVQCSYFKTLKNRPEKLREKQYASCLKAGVDQCLKKGGNRRTCTHEKLDWRGRWVGPDGEKGFFQIMPNGAIERQCGHGCDQFDSDCNAETAMCWFSKAQELCGEDPWLYVGGYGRSRCPGSVEEAQSWREVRRARAFLCDAVGDDECERRWPWDGMQ